jgi:hypothetical protein
MKMQKYTCEELLDLLGAYLGQIKRSGGFAPGVVIDDIEKSITYVLKKNDYNGRYKAYVETETKQ